MRLSQIQNFSWRQTASPCGIQIGERRVNWIKDSQLNWIAICCGIMRCSSVSGVFALTEGSLISNCTFILRDIRSHKNICRTDYSALHLLTFGRCLGKLFAEWQSWLWKCMAQVLLQSQHKKKRFSGACLAHLANLPRLHHDAPPVPPPHFQNTNASYKTQNTNSSYHLIWPNCKMHSKRTFNRCNPLRIPASSRSRGRWKPAHQIPKFFWRRELVSREKQFGVKR